MTPLVIVGGALANKPLSGGEAWVRLSWVEGLARLGVEVHLVEELSEDVCVDEAGSKATPEESVNVRFFRHVTELFGLRERATLVVGDETIGRSREELRELAQSADALINISGHVKSGDVFNEPRTRIYVDIDPGFTQYWHNAGALGTHIENHDFHFTIGENIGLAECLIPSGGIRWRATRQPVVLAQWPTAAADRVDRLTTVATWRGPYGPIEHQGRSYGLKVHEFRKILDIPRRVSQTCELALDIHPEDVKDFDALRAAGWHVVDPRQVVADPESFRRYVQGSGAELSPAQGLYAETRCGWFSDRSARYLSSGTPVLVQDTGFGKKLPVGEGLLAFRDLDEAINGAAAIASEYNAHACAARRIAEEYFDSDVVLGKLLDEAGVA